MPNVPTSFPNKVAKSDIIAQAVAINAKIDATLADQKFAVLDGTGFLKIGTTVLPESAYPAALVRSTAIPALVRAQVETALVATGPLTLSYAGSGATRTFTLTPKTAGVRLTFLHDGTNYVGPDNVAATSANSTAASRTTAGYGGSFRDYVGAPDPFAAGLMINGDAWDSP